LKLLLVMVVVLRLVLRLVLVLVLVMVVVMVATVQQMMVAEPDAANAQAHGARHHERRVGRQRAQRGRRRGAVTAGRHGTRHAQVRVSATAVRVSLGPDLLLFAPLGPTVLEPNLQRETVDRVSLPNVRTLRPDFVMGGFAKSAWPIAFRVRDAFRRRTTNDEWGRGRKYGFGVRG